MNDERRLRRRQGRYYTPRAVAECCWQILRAWIPAEELQMYRVVDPAVGDGVFLNIPCASGWIKPELTLGIDLFPPQGMPPPFRRYSGDGLLDHEEVDFRTGAFDLVIGNPPYGDTLLREWSLVGEEDDGLQTSWRYLTRYQIGAEEPPVIPPMEKLMDWLPSRIGRQYWQRFARCPVEVFFLQRFLALCRPGGWCAVVLPDGILANMRTGWLRQLIEARASLRAIISLPKTTFQREGTMANTSLVLLHCYKEDDSLVYLSAPDYCSQTQSFEQYLHNVACELTHEAPQSTGVWLNSAVLKGERWDPGFWNPRYHRLEAEMGPVEPLDKYIKLLTYGPIRPGKQPDLDPQGITVIGQSQFTAAGLDLSQAIRVVSGSLFDPPRSRVQRGDLLFPRSGEGSLLRLRAGVYDENIAANVSCFVDLLRLQGINPYYVWLVLGTRFLKAQIFRLKNGVGTPNLNFSEIRSLMIPKRPMEDQARWEERYRAEVAPYQIKRVKSSNNDEYTYWGTIADQRWKELVQAVEKSLEP